MKALPAIALLVFALSGCGNGGGATEPRSQPPTTLELPSPSSPPPITTSPRGRPPGPRTVAEDLQQSFGGTFRCELGGPANSKHWLYNCRHDHNPGALVVITASDGTVVSIHSEPG
jgi:hypothetical protein